MKGRLEKDALGRLQVPSHVYYGIFTTRALKNFQLTGLRAPRVFIKALGLIKEASAEINMDLGLLDKKLCRAIM
ncbi:MAG: aspartate ammonia-lyase, partial [Candidatus Gracilibacteria bacterium]